jgi:chromosome segregation ATPase
LNYLAPGLRELGRIYGRLKRRSQLIWERRELVRCETKLGLLGWQQADYDATLQPHVDQLADLERSQAQLTNESASMGLTVQQLEERRAAEKATYESQRAARVAARDPLVEPVEEIQRTLETRRRERKEMAERMAAVDQELATAEERYRVLLARGSHSASEEAEVQQWRRRVIVAPGEKKEYAEKLAALDAEIPRLETEGQQRKALLTVENEALQTLEKGFAASDKALADELATRKRDKQKLERKIDGLEKSKTRPYREIGRALADHGIEPLNQPQALEAVLHQRERIAVLESELANSRAHSRQEKRVEVWGSWALLFTFAVLLWGVIWFVILAK